MSTRIVTSTARIMLWLRSSGENRGSEHGGILALSAHTLSPLLSPSLSHSRPDQTVCLSMLNPTQIRRHELP